MILGTGIDIIELSRIQKAYTDLGDKFLKKILHPKEQEIFSRIQGKRRKTEFLAGRFAAKEAFMKAKGVGITLSFFSIAVLNEKSGAPYILYEESAPFEKIHLSLSHSKDYAVASVMIEKIS